MEELGHWQVIDYYCNRGRMENFIGEGKQGFDFAAVSSRSKTVNANRLQFHALEYSIFNWFRRLVLPGHMCKSLVDTVRLKLLKIAAKVVHSGRYVKFKLCSSCSYNEEAMKHSAIYGRWQCSWNKNMRTLTPEKTKIIAIGVVCPFLGILCG